MERTTALSIHSFAGGWLHGIKKRHDIVASLELSAFGAETMCDVFDVDRYESKDPSDWPELSADYVIGHPRCTGFSSITGGYSKSCHGPWAKQTKDIHDLINYSVGKYPIIIFESVQQAYSVGKPLLDYLRDEVLAPAGYRVAHVLLNAASFGNAQQRKRYFFVAYEKSKNFNIAPPPLPDWMTFTHDVLWDLRHRETNEMHPSAKEYDFDSYVQLTDDEKHCVPNLPNGWALNMFAEYAYDLLPEKYKEVWAYRCSCMPFSMHCIARINWLRPFPTIFSSTGRIIHPEYNRPLTVGEIATVMGWEGLIPKGQQPIAQIAKGVVPQVATWLTEQVDYYLDDVWGSDDYYSTYNQNKGVWEGGDAAGSVDKVFDLTRYTPHGWKDYSQYTFTQHRLEIKRAKLTKKKTFDRYAGLPGRGFTLQNNTAASQGQRPILRKQERTYEGAPGLSGHPS